LNKSSSEDIEKISKNCPLQLPFGSSLLTLNKFDQSIIRNNSFQMNFWGINIFCKNDLLRKYLLGKLFLGKYCEKKFF